MRVLKEDAQARELLDEVRRLRREVAELRGRVEALSADAPAPEEQEEREGDFGPAVRRSAPSRHQSAVNKALTMLGVLPPQAETKHSAAMDASHARALERMREMDSGAAPVEVLDDDERAGVESLVPLPELRVAEERAEDEDAHGEREQVELDGALSIDLVRPSSRVPGLLGLLFETAAVSALLVLLPAAYGVLAATAFVALLGAPRWRRRATLRAHARFLALVVLGRCLLPDFWMAPVAEPWLNLRFAAFLAAAAPALFAALLGRVGWALLALAAGLVSGFAVALEAGFVEPGLGVGFLVAGLAVYRHRGSL